MEDILPLLIVIAIAIIGALSRKKKRIESENISTPNQRDSQDDDFLGWFERLNIGEDDSPLPEEKPFLRMTREESPQAKSIVREPVVKEVIPNIFSKYSGIISPEEREDLMSREGIMTVKKRGVAEGDLTKQTAEEAEAIEKKPKFEFDLRYAVIYNEILNRKYI